ncbi:MAG: hypothetical protein HY904_03765 [Deltaproteobacteria bacterium]|nr:hypothetical protein [Deltaproteobacteria bacterium]
MARAAARKPRVSRSVDDVEALRSTVSSLVEVMGRAMEVLTLVRQDQMRILGELGMRDPGHPDVHRCVDGGDAVARTPARKTGGRSRGR